MILIKPVVWPLISTEVACCCFPVVLQYRISLFFPVPSNNCQGAASEDMHEAKWSVGAVGLVDKQKGGKVKVVQPHCKRRDGGCSARAASDAADQAGRQPVFGIQSL